MKVLISLLLIPSILCGVCHDCDFPYKHYLNTYKEHFEHAAEFYEGKIINEKHLKNDRERAIFYSGCAFSLEYMIDMGNKY